jgi:hypothetical protein
MIYAVSTFLFIAISICVATYIIAQWLEKDEF